MGVNQLSSSASNTLTHFDLQSCKTCVIVRRCATSLQQAQKNQVLNGKGYVSLRSSSGRQADPKAFLVARLQSYDPLQCSPEVGYQRLLRMATSRVPSLAPRNEERFKPRTFANAAGLAFTDISSVDPEQFSAFTVVLL
uniref:Uncharacterized protein n=1 Tax=Rhodosorus marinus TaxID=101924 RepID=A0A7S3E839_9RHOD|mmetsp:Transcript_16305/g.67586  ORF Transcript_16305/g.67586 Transcript_16305/m.67586 type:complete len:139 (+) Transcript_16305:1445-1861(+)